MKSICFTSFIIILFLINTALCNQGPTDTQSQKSPQQLEQEIIEEGLKRLQQPDFIREREMLNNLNEAMENYYKSKNETSRQKYESLYKQALELPKPSAKIYSVCATAANLFDQPKQAINILKKAIAEYPDERVWGPKVPLKLSGYYRIGSIASRMNDPKEATEAYESAIQNSQKIESSQIYQILSLMHLVDIASNQLNDKKLALKRIENINDLIKSIENPAIQSDTENTLKFINSWAIYEQETLETGKSKPYQKSDLKREEYTLPYMLSMIHATLSQPSTPELEQIVKSDLTSIDNILIKFALAFICLHDLDYTRQLNDKLPKTENYLLDMIKTNYFFKPYAEAVFDLLQERKEKYKKPNTFDN